MNIEAWTIRAWLPCTSSSAACRSNALDSFISRLLRRVHAADSYEHHAVHKVVSAISTAATGSIHFLWGDSVGFSAIGVTLVRFQCPVAGMKWDMSNLASFRENNRARDTGDNRSHQNTHLRCLERRCLAEGEIGDEQRHGKSDATQHSNSNNLTPANTIQHPSQPSPYG